MRPPCPGPSRRPSWSHDINHRGRAAHHRRSDLSENVAPAPRRRRRPAHRRRVDAGPGRGVRLTDRGHHLQRRLGRGLGAYRSGPGEHDPYRCRGRSSGPVAAADPLNRCGLLRVGRDLVGREPYRRRPDRRGHRGGPGRLPVTGRRSPRRGRHGGRRRRRDPCSPVEGLAPVRSTTRGRLPDRGHVRFRRRDGFAERAGGRRMVRTVAALRGGGRCRVGSRIGRDQ